MLRKNVPLKEQSFLKIIVIVRRSEMANNIPKDYELPIYLFHDDTNLETYKFLGCHKGEMMGKQGYFFRVWAAHAKAISLVGDFNNWDEQANPMTLMGGSEIWETFVPGLKRFDTYKYCVFGCDGKKHMKWLIKQWKI
jgi:1,4-alpha-glucan branching enzyme